MRRNHFPIRIMAGVGGCLVGVGTVLAGGGGGIVDPSKPSNATSSAVKPVKAAVGVSTVTKKASASDNAVGAVKKTDPRWRVPAKKLFGHERRAAAMAPAAIGSFSKGCLAGGEMMPAVGPYWQAMRLSRNRNWAHPTTILLLKKLAEDAHKQDGWRGLLVGDLTQPRGGPMLTGHKSHQIGLDADVWLREMPANVMSRKKRDTYQPISMLKDALSVDPAKFTDKHIALIRRAASYPEVARLGVNPAIKHALCKAAGGDTPWLAKIQGWGGHHYHMHIRLKCPAGSPGCKDQSRPRGTSCAASARWYRDAKAWADLPAAEKKRRSAEANKKRKKRKPKPPIMLSGLPSGCQQVLSSDGRDMIESVVVLPVANPARGTGTVVAPVPALARR